MAKQKSNDRPKIIVAIPAYNEEKYVGTIVLKTRQYASEVIVLDDGSTDQTAHVARLAGALVIKHQQNKGKGASIQMLLAEARKRNPDVLVLLDADSQHNPDEIPVLIKPISEGFDLVIGSRERQRENIPTYRRIGQRVLSYFSGILSGERQLDSECGFRALSRKAIAELKLEQTGFAIETEMIAAATDSGLRITQVPISAIYTKDGSTLNPVAHGVGNLTWIFTMISERKPLLFFGVTGIALVVFGAITAARVLHISSMGGVIPVGTALMSVLFLTIGIFTIFTGLILNILARRKG
ncbi:Undecaprenyl-phosphate 4-deoxy-4-formamido-L-arabinose transferase [subsurface metagenome]